MYAFIKVKGSFFKKKKIKITYSTKNSLYKLHTNTVREQNSFQLAKITATNVELNKYPQYLGPACY